MTKTKGKKKESINFEEREQIVFNRHYDPANYDDGGICKLEKISYTTVKKLLEKGYLFPDSSCDCGPEVSEFVSFVEEHNPDNWYFHGYVVSANRRDTRVTIEGIGSFKPLDPDSLIDFLQYFRIADEIMDEKDQPVYCWYD